jgi:molybdate transport system substrate-binding protein
MRPLSLLLIATLALGARAGEVRVFAAASLTEALRDISAAYEKTSGDRIVLNLGASSLLARQIEQGAPADLFLSADEAKMDALAKRGLIVAASRVRVLSNTLVVVVPKDSRVAIASAAHLARLRSIALAEPSSVPAGVYARAWLVRQKVWDRVAAKVIPTENVRAALAAVESGNVDAAVVYRTDALLSKRVRVAYAVPRGDAPPISYPFVIVKEGENRSGGARFLAYLRSPAARAVFVKYGFLVL